MVNIYILKQVGNNGATCSQQISYSFLPKHEGSQPHTSAAKESCKLSHKLILKIIMVGFKFAGTYIIRQR
jgi:hypothetical protein